MVEGSPGSAFDILPSENPLVPMFTDTKLKVSLSPNVDTGDAVEYVAVKRVSRFEKPGDFWFLRYLTTAVPVASETVILDTPADRKLALYESETVRGKAEVANGRRIERWEVSHAEPPPVGEAPEPVFAVSSILTWDDFGRWIDTLNESARKPSSEVAALATNLTAQKSAELERIAALYAYVATKVRYISVSFGIGHIQPHAAAEVLRNGYGDCKDQTALLSALLTAAGFKAHAVLTTPALGVAVREIPVVNQFVHEFVAVDTGSRMVFLDPSLGPAPPQTLAPGVRGHTALLIGDSGASVLDIPVHSPMPMRTVLSLKGKVSSDGAFEGSTRFEFRGIAEAPLRRAFLGGNVSDKEKLLRQLAGPEFGNAAVRQISTSDPNDLSKRFEVKCELTDAHFFTPSKSSIRITLELPGPRYSLDFCQFLSAEIGNHL